MKTKTITTTLHPIVMGCMLLCILSLSSCMDVDYYPCVRPNGHVVEETRVAPAFTGIELRLHGQVFIAPGSEHSVVVETSENLMDLVRTSVSGGKLVIEQDRCIRCRLDDINIYITMPRITELSLAGSGRIIVTEAWVADDLLLNVSGSGLISGSFTSEQIRTRITGSGDVDIRGVTMDHSIRISGSGQVHAREMQCNRAEVRLSGSGSASLSVSDLLDARITGSGSIYFSGDPAIKSSITGTGKIVKL